MSQESEKGKAGEKPPYYGTFPGGGAPSYTHGQPAIGFPQPVPPPGSVPSAPPYYPPPPPPPHGYQAVPAYAVAEGTPVREPRLPCCGIGLGWFLFIIGFFLAAIPWYIGAFILICVRRVDYREKPGYVACTIAAILAIIVVIFGVTKGTHTW